MGDAPPPPRKGRQVAVALILLLIVAAGIATFILLRARPPVVTVDISDQTAPEQPLAYYLARADAARGEAYFARCSACHTVERGGPDAVGPNLWGTMGRPIASQHPGFSYSPALASHGGRWDWETMNRFLDSPRAFQPGTRMTFAGIIAPQDRADVMLYLNRQGGALPPPGGAR